MLGGLSTRIIDGAPTTCPGSEGQVLLHMAPATYLHPTWMLSSPGVWALLLSMLQTLRRDVWCFGEGLGRISASTASITVQKSAYYLYTEIWVLKPTGEDEVGAIQAPGSPSLCYSNPRVDVSTG